jgi:hypothetical protein
MRRFALFASLAVVAGIAYFAAEKAASAQSGEAASKQTQAKQPQVAIFTIDGSKYPRAENGKATFWTAEELRKKYISSTAPAMDHLEWTPSYRISVLHRPQGEAATVGGEMHEDKTQIYLILSGSGTILIGGQPKLDASAGPGEHRSQLIGATPHHVKEGDLISISPYTWHASFSDPGQTMTYMMFHIENRQTIP